MIAAAFYPKDVILRLSDFKTNDSISLNPDTILKTTLAILEKERSKP